MNARIINTAYHLPNNKVSNQDLVKTYSKSYEEKYKKKLVENTIVKACGIKTRYYVGKSDRLRDLAKDCIVKLLDKSRYQLSDIDAIIIANLSPESFTPSNASLIFEELVNYYDFRGLSMTAYDINSACSGFLFGIEQAENWIKLNKKKRIIVCGVETLSRLLNKFDYHTGILFGDGAAAFLIEASENPGIISTSSTCITDNINDITYLSPLSSDYDTVLNLEGYKVYRNGTNLTIKYIRDYLIENKLAIDDFDYVICHQANIRMLNEIAKELKIPSSKMLSNLENVGNTAAASIPLCAAQFDEKEKFKKGDRILLCSFGAGYALAHTDLIW